MFQFIKKHLPPPYALRIILHCIFFHCKIHHIILLIFLVTLPEFLILYLLLEVLFVRLLTEQYLQLIQQLRVEYHLGLEQGDSLFCELRVL
jgi:hypothetical protein